MYAALARKLKLCRQQLEALKQSPTLEGPDAYVVQRREQLAHQKAALGYTMQATVDRQKRRLAQAAASLDALSPLKVLGRGYGLLLAEDRVVRSVTQLHPGDTITAKLADGQIKATVEEIL
jgi:exodeoxyribonuclease VII large subunit